MGFKTVKKGYDPAEVDRYIKDLRAGYEKTSAEQLEHIAMLKRSNETLLKEAVTARDPLSLINKTLISAREKAGGIKPDGKAEPAAPAEETAERQYGAETKRISGSGGGKGVNIDAVRGSLTEDDDAYERVQTSFSRSFNPARRIKNYYNNQKQSPAADPRTGANYPLLNEVPSDSGFSIEEALNPTEALEDILKDLLD